MDTVAIMKNRVCTLLEYLEVFTGLIHTDHHQDVPGEDLCGSEL